MIYFDHLTYTYPNASAPVLKDIVLEVGDGAFVLVTGYSGVGKSTLLRCLNGLVPHFTGGTLFGDISVAGHNPVSEGPEIMSRVVGFVFQDPEAQFVLDRVEDEIAFALENAAVPPLEMRSRVDEILDLLGITDLRHRSLDTLSGGEKQKAAIAAAMVLRPSILVLDEPTSQLDPQSAEEVLQALVGLNHDLGLTVLLAEHRMERILPYADQLVYVQHLVPGGNGAQQVLSGAPQRVLQDVDLVPPMIALAKTLGWDELPLTIREGRQFAKTTLTLPEVHPQKPDMSNLSEPVYSPGEKDTRQPVLYIRDLQYAYGEQTALQGVSLGVDWGELVILMGRNGSGKTTLLKCISGLLRPQHGVIELDGESLIGKKTADICRTVGYLPQQPDDLLFADTVADELTVTLRNHNLLQNPPLDPDGLLEKLELQGVASAYPRDLSVGQRQRVSLAAVTVTMPRVLLLDEPTRGMDYAAKEDLVRLLREWQKEGSAILLVTHDVELAALAADRIVVLSGGTTIADDAPSQICASFPLFEPQIASLFPGTGWLTVNDALAGLGMADSES